MVEERERPEPERLAADLSESGARQSFVDEAAGVEGRFWYARRRETRSQPGACALHEQPERPERRIIPGIEKNDQPRPVIGREDDMTTRPGHASHLLYRQLRSLEPGNNAESNHEIEAGTLKGQSTGITEIHGE